MTNQSTVDQQEISKFASHSKEWWDKEGPLKTLHDINPARLEFIQQYLSLAQLSILDVGCGGGILSEAMAKQKARVTGLDVEIAALETARVHAKRNHLNIEYIDSPIEDFEAEAFDAITCMEMLEHVNHPELVIEHCTRLLKPGGYLFLSTINRTVKAYALAVLAAEYVLGLLPKQTHDFKKFIKPSELLTITRKAGLELRGLAGVAYNPLMRRAKLEKDVGVNYLVACFKPPLPAT